MFFRDIRLLTIFSGAPDVFSKILQKNRELLKIVGGPSVVLEGGGGGVCVFSVKVKNTLREVGCFGL